MTLIHKHVRIMSLHHFAPGFSGKEREVATIDEMMANGELESLGSGPEIILITPHPAI